MDDKQAMHAMHAMRTMLSARLLADLPASLNW